MAVPSRIRRATSKVRAADVHIVQADSVGAVCIYGKWLAMESGYPWKVVMLVAAVVLGRISALPCQVLYCGMLIVLLVKQAGKKQAGKTDAD